ncbi:hypothetical protein [Flavobacterium sp.]|uniref:hypothetical protein n=1 Tax=Flavobacterium sp. TaxID=239 RepID=UPI002627EEE8|nr:hypothetical protein [Flavobacterium sp.]
MAKTKGIIAFTGTLGGVNFYVLNGVPVSRMAGGGFNGKKIKTSPKMVRVRENGSEFKGCMQAVKHFKAGLRKPLSSIKDGTLHQRLVSLFTKIKNTDTVSVRGARNVANGLLTEEGRRLLRGYVLDSGPGLAQTLRQPFAFSWDDTGLVFKGFDAGLVAFPNGATQVELTAFFYVFDFEKHESVLASSETKAILRDSGDQGTLSLTAPALPESNAVRMGLLHYRFQQELNGSLYPLQGEGGAGMEVVWVA